MRASGANEVSYIVLEVLDELHLLQPQASVHISAKTPDRFLKAACRVIRKGYGYPSVFNADAIVMEMLRVGKSVEDAREGGCSGCVEVGAFGKEAYILTGYFNLPKVLEITLNDGVDPRTGRMDTLPFFRRTIEAAGLEDVVVEQDEGLEQLDQLDDFVARRELLERALLQGRPVCGQRPDHLVALLDRHAEERQLAFAAASTARGAVEEARLLADARDRDRLPGLDDPAGDAFAELVAHALDRRARDPVGDLDVDLVAQRVQQRDDAPHHLHRAGKDVEDLV